MPDQFEYPELSWMPDDITPEELAGVIVGRPVMRGGVNVAEGFQFSDQLTEKVLTDAGIAVTYEDE